MNEELPPSGLTRRSFIKRSVVAAAAVSSMTIFSGLVNATSTHPSGVHNIAQPDFCRLERLTPCQETEHWENGEFHSYKFLCQVRCIPSHGAPDAFPGECFEIEDEEGEKTWVILSPEERDSFQDEVFCLNL